MRGWPQFLESGCLWSQKVRAYRHSPGLEGREGGSHRGEWRRGRRGGTWRPPQPCTQENFSTIKEPLINLTYVPKLHMQRMIPISLKPNSMQAQLHISSAILLFVFTGRSLTTCLLHIRSVEMIQTEWCWYWGEGMLSLFNMFLMEMQAGGKLDGQTLCDVLDDRLWFYVADSAVAILAAPEPVRPKRWSWGMSHESRKLAISQHPHVTQR